MRVVLALGSDDLTTKQLRGHLPDVAQASLYRAIGRLVEAGIIAVVDRRQRGGAMERVYRVVQSPDTDHETATPHGFVAAADTLARALSVDAAHWAATPQWRASGAQLRREAVRLSDSELESLLACFDDTLDEVTSRDHHQEAPVVVLTFAAIPVTSATPPAGS